MQLYVGIILFVFVIIFLSFHEYGHAKAASLIGDKTAEYAGRMTLNPAVHIDIFGTVLLPIMFVLAGIPPFGWAKPVPVDSNISKRDMTIVAFAGPFMNIACAFGVVAILKIIIALSIPLQPNLLRIIRDGAYINLFLAFFNLLPLNPLDGYKVVYGLLPYKYAREFAKTEAYGMIIFMAILWLPFLLHIPNPIFNILGEISYNILRLMLAIFRLPYHLL